MKRREQITAAMLGGAALVTLSMLLVGWEPLAISITVGVWVLAAVVIALARRRFS